MSEVIIILHLLIVAALIGVVLLQRSEGGGLGMGGGVSGFLTSRGKANVLTRTTAILGALFFVTSLVLALLARPSDNRGSIFDTAPAQEEIPAVPQAPAAPVPPQAPISK
jgi:preprotein translocase subunit SecG